ncbi:class I SAM-dependent methyltransferase [Metabacillus idriensis]|uniref:class I SAM-dependent DNA methyltransferase n=1 Tax=Metabacillus idriensis TaxID=324768 RepID=UPI00203E4A3E|nr:class I SAM-dependent methyltransferase [Metabacillus idriensis]MCM3596782.1 class I SAM-dependent methyltransferase [Metabacillus idriensis]
MEYKGSAAYAYDQQEFFDRYMQRRHRTESPNTSIEKPSFFELIGEISGTHILDLGCGDASLGMDLLNLNVSSYTGIDGSANMCHKAAETLKGTKGRVIQSTMEEYSFPPAEFDLVVSQVALHYLEDFAGIANKVYQTLKSGGKFVFSVQHPLLTASFKSMTESGKKSDWIVDDYFHSGKRTEPWIGEEVVKYHRTTEEYFTALQNAGFLISGLNEGTPQAANFDDPEEYKRRMRIPLFLLFSCEKPPT